jgi:hypothetical protein
MATLNKSKRWTSIEDEILINSAKEGKRTIQVANTLGRTMAAVSGRKHWFMKKGLIPSDAKFSHSPGTFKGKTSTKSKTVVKTSKLVENTTPKVVTSVKINKQPNIKIGKEAINNVKVEELAKIAKTYGIKITLVTSGDNLKIDLNA